MNNRVLEKAELELFKGILSSTQSNLMSSLNIFLKDIYGEKNVVRSKEYIVAYGEIPVGLIAHLDTVHKFPIRELFYDKEENVLWSPQGLGADDRAGVYSIIEIIRKGYKPTIIFTTDEEKGGVGASCLVADYPKGLDRKLNFLIELDRRGYEDCVFYNCINEDFIKYIEDYGFKEDYGSFSDISFLAPSWKIAATNLSIGYEDEHTYAERLYLNAMFLTIDKVCELFDSLDKDLEFEYIEGFRNYFGSLSETEEICYECLGIFDTIIKTRDDEQYCKSCYEKIFSTCIDCGEDFKDRLKVHLLCDSCREERKYE